MEQLERFSVSMPAALLADFDADLAQASYGNRSEALRDIIRDFLVRRQWDTPDSPVVGTITIVYDHHTRELQETLTALQHEYGEAVVCTTHVHMDHHHCLEVIVVRGKSHQVKTVADRLLSTRGVKHGGLTATTTGPLH